MERGATMKKMSRRHYYGHPHHLSQYYLFYIKNIKDRVLGAPSRAPDDQIISGHFF
jgi:hypothetical protein